VAGVDGLRISDNEVRGLTARQSGNGIVLTDGLDPAGIGHVWVTGNHVDEVGGAAILVRVPLGSALIKQNILEGALSGIVFRDAGAVAHGSIENNQLLRIGEVLNPTGSVIGIQVLAGQDVQITGNVVSGFARDAVQASDRVGIRVGASGVVRISGNHLSDLGPRQTHAGYVAAVEIHAPYSHALVGDNIMSRTSGTDLAPSQWQAIRIAPVTERKFSSVLGGLIIPATEEETYLLTATRLRVLAQVQPDSVAIRGNHGSARAVASPLVMAFGSANCIMTDNHFEATPVAGGAAGARLVELEGTTVIATSNRLRWNGSDQDALNISGTKAFTALGNITMGNIRINGGLLPGPWDKLNVLAS